MRAASFFFHLSLSLRVIYESVLCQCKNNAANFFMTQFTGDGQRDPAKHLASSYYMRILFEIGEGRLFVFFLQKRISIKKRKRVETGLVVGVTKDNRRIRVRFLFLSKIL